MRKPYKVAEETYVIPSPHPVPGHGVLQVNSMVIRGEQPVLVDTGMPAYRDQWKEMVFELVDPQQVRWIFLSHDDRDHSGNAREVLEMCPNATLLTNFLGVGKLGFEWQVPIQRVRFMNNGEAIDIGDRQLVALRPPLFDAPATRGIWDAKTSVYYAADAFGASMPDETEKVEDFPFAVYEDGFYWFNRVNHVWFELADPLKVDNEVDNLRRLDPHVIVSAHGPTATGRSQELFDMIARIPRMEPVPEITQHQLEVMLSGGEPEEEPQPAQA